MISAAIDPQMEKHKHRDAGWRSFFRIIRQIDMPWLLVLLSLIFEMGYSNLLLSLPVTTAALMSGSLEVSALWDAVIYYAIYGGVSVVRYFIYDVTANLAIRNARNKVWGGMLRIRTDYYDQNAPAALSSAITNDLEAAVRSLVNLMITAVPTIYYIVAAVKMIGNYDSLLMLSVLVLLPVQYLYMVVIGRWKCKTQTGIYRRIGQLTGYLAERTRNLSLIKYYTNEDEELKNGVEVSEDLYKANMQKVKVDCADTGFSTAIELLQNLVTIVFGVILLQRGRIDIAQWVAFFLFSAKINSRFGELITKWQSLKTVQGIAVRTAEIMEAPQEQTEKEAKAAVDLIPRSGPSPSVCFQEVSLSYGQKQALKNVSFTVPAGTATAIVGLCGSGKTTLLNLLERFYEVGDGSILLDDRDIRSLSLAELRSRFSYVQQDAGVFSGSVREILTYGIHKPFTDEELTTAIRRAGAWDFIQALPDGLDAQVAADGQSLSGGQRQRLVLAREFLRNADVLLLDEPTSALDAATAQAVEQTIFEIFRGKTILMVTHDLSVLRSMDQVVVLQEGELVGQGTYESLKESCPLLQEMERTRQAEVRQA